MFVLLRKGADDSGVILVIVLVVLLVMATISIGIFSQSLSQTKASRSQVDEIVAEQLAKGIFYNSYNSLDIDNLNGPTNSIGVNYALNGRTFTVSRTSISSGNISNISIDLAY